VSPSGGKAIDTQASTSGGKATDTQAKPSGGKAVNDAYDDNLKHVLAAIGKAAQKNGAEDKPSAVKGATEAKKPTGVNAAGYIKKPTEGKAATDIKKPIGSSAATDIKKPTDGTATAGKKPTASKGKSGAGALSVPGEAKTLLPDDRKKIEDIAGAATGIPADYEITERKGEVSSVDGAGKYYVEKPPEIGSSAPPRRFGPDPFEEFFAPPPPTEAELKNRRIAAASRNKLIGYLFAGLGVLGIVAGILISMLM
jgi:hypothetical protein